MDGLCISLTRLKVHNKWKSRRWIICLWAMFMATALMIYSLFTKTDLSWFGTAFALFQLIIGGYVAADSLTKPKVDA